MKSGPDETEAVGDCPPALRGLANGAAHVAAILLQISAAAIVVNALYRYTLGGGFGVISEVSRFTLLVVVFLSLAGTHLVGGHVQVELLVFRLGPRARSVLNGWILPAASLGFLALIFWASWSTTIQMFERGTTTPSRPAVLLWPLMSVVTFGTGLLICVLVSSLATRLMRLVRRTSGQ